MPKPRDPFRVDKSAALEALRLNWGADYDFTLHEGRFRARHHDAGNVLSGETPDDITRVVRADWKRRHPGLS